MTSKCALPSDDLRDIVFPSAPPMYSEIFPEEQGNMDNVSLNSNANAEPTVQQRTGLRAVHKVKLSMASPPLRSRFQLVAKMTPGSHKCVKNVSLAEAVQLLNKWSVKKLTFKCSPRAILDISSQLHQDTFRNMNKLKMDILSSPDSSVEDLAAVKKKAFDFLASAKKLSFLRLYANEIKGSVISLKKEKVKQLVCKCEDMKIDLLDVTTAIEKLNFQHDATIWIPFELRKAFKAYAKHQEEYKKTKWPGSRLTFIHGRTKFVIGDDNQEIMEKLLPSVGLITAIGTALLIV